jgi:hypothetical protein
MTHLGQMSVALFFMITAFLFWGRVLDRGKTIDRTEFIVSRLYRLYPVYLLMVALRWPPKTEQVTKRESSLGTAVGPEVRLVEYTEEAQS